jgi:hypothetical protein
MAWCRVRTPPFNHDDESLPRAPAPRPLEVTIGDGVRAMVDGGYIKPRLRDAAATTTAAAAAAPPAEAAAAPSSS